MVSAGAVGIDGTTAGVNTFPVLAGQGGGTVWVHQALIGHAADKWISIMVGRTYAVGPVAAWLTDGIGATLSVETGVLAFPVNAGLVVTALKVALAPGCIKIIAFRNNSCQDAHNGYSRSSQTRCGSPSYPLLQTQ